MKPDKTHCQWFVSNLCARECCTTTSFPQCRQKSKPDIPILKFHSRLLATLHLIKGRRKLGTKLVVWVQLPDSEWWSLEELMTGDGETPKTSRNWWRRLLAIGKLTILWPVAIKTSTVFTRLPTRRNDWEGFFILLFPSHKSLITELVRIGSSDFNSLRPKVGLLFTLKPPEPPRLGADFGAVMTSPSFPIFNSVRLGRVLRFSRDEIFCLRNF